VLLKPLGHFTVFIRYSLIPLYQS